MEFVLTQYLNLGYELVTQNFNYYQSEKLGEIDLIFLKNNRLYLVEVKTRKNENFATTLEQITNKKLKCIYKSYQGFIKKNPIFRNLYVHFDLATVVDSEIKIYPNCYSFESLFRG